MGMNTDNDNDKQVTPVISVPTTPRIWSPSENNPRCPRCVKLIDEGAHREDVRCFGGVPCEECEGVGLSGDECRVGEVDGGWW
jgi:hypothetical protein